MQSRVLTHSQRYREPCHIRLLHYSLVWTHKQWHMQLCAPTHTFILKSWWACMYATELLFKQGHMSKCEKTNYTFYLWMSVNFSISWRNKSRKCIFKLFHLEFLFFPPVLPCSLFATFTQCTFSFPVFLPQWLWAVNQSGKSIQVAAWTESWRVTGVFFEPWRNTFIFGGKGLWFFLNLKEMTVCQSTQNFSIHENKEAANTFRMHYSARVCVSSICEMFARDKFSLTHTYTHTQKWDTHGWCYSTCELPPSRREKGVWWGC